MQNETEVVSHIFKRAVFFCEEEALFVFKREIYLRFAEKDRKTFLKFDN